MNEFVFRILNSLILRSEIFDWIIFFLAQPLSLLAVLALGIYAVRKILEKYNGENGIKVLRKWSFVFGSAIVAWFIGGLLKEWLATPRPFIDLSNVNLLFPFGNHDSFPSGHVTFLSALAAGVYFFLNSKKLVWALGTGAVVVGLARVAAGIHWPFDIVGGIILGVAVSWFLFRVQKRYK